MRRVKSVMLALAATAAGVLPVSWLAAAAPARAVQCKTVQLTRSVAVHHDPTFTSRVVRTARRGDLETTCLVAIGRGDPYRACGSSGYDWYLVRGGYIPDVCAQTVR